MEGPGESVPAGEVCIPNIGARGRDRRRRHGITWLVLGMAASVMCIIRQPPLAAFAVPWVVYFMAALGYFQAAKKT
jgi:hypothetical protein